MGSYHPRRPSPAMMVALLALFVALGGTSYAVATGSIDSREIKNNSVRSTDIRNNGVRSQDVRDGALLAMDFKAGQLPVGEKGEKGDTGATGPTGQQGPPGVSGLELVSQTSASNSDSDKTATAICPAGKRVIGTGADIDGSLSGATPTTRLTDVVIREVIPSPPNVVPGLVGVTAVEEEATVGSWSVTAYALCANVS